MQKNVFPNQIAKSEMLCKFELKAIGGKNRPNVCRCWRRLGNQFLRVRVRKEREREREIVCVSERERGRGGARDVEEKQWIISLNLELKFSLIAS